LGRHELRKTRLATMKGSAEMLGPQPRPMRKKSLRREVDPGYLDRSRFFSFLFLLIFPFLLFSLFFFFFFSFSFFFFFFFSFFRRTNAMVTLFLEFGPGR